MHDDDTQDPRPDEALPAAHSDTADEEESKQASRPAPLAAFVGDGGDDEVSDSGMSDRHPGKIGDPPEPETDDS